MRQTSYRYPYRHVIHQFWNIGDKHCRLDTIANFFGGQGQLTWPGDLTGSDLFCSYTQKNERVVTYAPTPHRGKVYERGKRHRIMQWMCWVLTLVDVRITYPYIHPNETHFFFLSAVYLFCTHLGNSRNTKYAIPMWAKCTKIHFKSNLLSSNC